ncbi:hypothetical protein CHUAL_010226 [Chamberlinius hualienensis]
MSNEKCGSVTITQTHSKHKIKELSQSDSDQALNDAFQSLFVKEEVPEHLKQEIHKMEDIFRKYHLIVNEDQRARDDGNEHQKQWKFGDGDKSNEIHDHPSGNRLETNTKDKKLKKKTSPVLDNRSKPHNQNVQYQEDKSSSKQKQPAKSNGVAINMSTKSERKKTTTINLSGDCSQDTLEVDTIKTSVSNDVYDQTKISLNETEKKLEQKKIWTCTFCTFENPSNIYVCKECCKTNEKQKVQIGLDKGAIPKMIGQSNKEAQYQLKSPENNNVKLHGSRTSSNSATKSRHEAIEGYNPGEDPYEHMQQTKPTVSNPIESKNTEENQNSTLSWETIKGFFNWLMNNSNDKMIPELSSLANKPWELLDKGIQKKYRKVMAEAGYLNENQAQNAAILMHIFPEADPHTIIDICLEQHDIKNAFTKLANKLKITTKKK